MVRKKNSNDLLKMKIYLKVIAWLKYKEFAFNKEKQLREHKVVNFDIIHNACRGDQFIKSIDLLENIRLLQAITLNRTLKKTSGYTSMHSKNDRYDFYLEKKLSKKC